MDRALGAYGLRLQGVDTAARWLVPQLPDAPLLKLVRVLGDVPDRPSVIDGSHADLGLVEGVWFETRAGSDTVTFTSPRRLGDDELVHPLLAPAAALHWLWRGCETLHAGAVLLGGGAVLLLGDREAGKSTTLAAMAEAGLDVLTDDLVVVQPELTMPPGPRGIDRRPPPDATGAGTLVVAGEAVRGGTRVRQTLDEAPAAPALPIRAWVQLRWGDALAFSPISGAERLGVLARARRVQILPGRPETVLDLAALPAFRLQRPREPAQIAPALAELIEHFS